MLLVATEQGIGRVVGESIEILDLPHPDLAALIRDAGSFAPAATARLVAEHAIGTIGLRCPLSGPLNIWGIGLNYHSKATLTGRAIPTVPILFVKPGSALTGPGAVPIPAVPSSQLDYEAEVALIIGRPLSVATPAEAWDAVVGISSANDMTARDVMRATNTPLLAKGFDNFSPVGPSVRPTVGLRCDFDLAVRSWVNGELRQDGRTSDFIIGPADLVSLISQYCTLQPGDVVLTGTPAGTGQDRSEFLMEGDRVAVEIGDLLVLENVLIQRTRNS